MHPLIHAGHHHRPADDASAAVTGLGPVPVIAPGTHDTASAVAAVPAEGKNWAYISSGTWSLMGMEADRPVSTPKAFEYNFTNEGGVFNTIRFLKNIMGLWLVQRCRADFGDDTDYGTLTQLAADAPAFVSLIDPDRDMFMNPPSMTDAIADFCKKTGQPVPRRQRRLRPLLSGKPGHAVPPRAGQIEEIYDNSFDRIHIVGGGTQNTAAQSTDRRRYRAPVITGPVEATVIGNIIMQAIGAGHIGSLAEGPHHHPQLLRDANLRADRHRPMGRSV
jgi:rhamnulokinase